MEWKSFTTRYNGRANRLTNEIRVAQAYDDDANKPTTVRPFKGLWDTGATNTLITARVAEECGLEPIGFTQINTASGLFECPVFFVSIWLPNYVVIQRVRVSQGLLTGDIDLLIGMDIIGLGDFAVNHLDRVTSFSFRIPSMERIDYTNQGQPVQETAQVGRNDPCPCGSGKKYKNCHGRQAARA